MTAITAQPATTAVPDAIDATPGQAPVQQPATGRPCPRGAVPGGDPAGATVRCAAATRAATPTWRHHRVKRPTGQVPHRVKPGGRL